MGKQFASITAEHKVFLAKQKLYFVGTAATDGRVNISPKAMDTFRVLDDNTVLWLNLTGSGNETATHLSENDRMTIMFCALEGKPYILRLYGHAVAIHSDDSKWDELIAHFPPHIGARQVMYMKVDLVQKSCGYSIPLFDYQEERSILTDWANKKGKKGIKEYWSERNNTSLDGKPTKFAPSSETTD